MLLARRYRRARLDELALALGDSLVADRRPRTPARGAGPRAWRAPLRAPRPAPRASAAFASISASARSSARSRWARAASCLASSVEDSVRSRSAFWSSRNLVEICCSRAVVRASAASELGLQVGEPLLLCGRRLGALRQLLLALLERRLLRGDLRCAAVDLRRAQRQALRVREALLESRLQVRELVARIALARDRLASSARSALQLLGAFAATGSAMTTTGARRAAARRRGAGRSASAASRRPGVVRPAPLPRRDAARAGARRPVPKPCSVS